MSVSQGLPSWRADPLLDPTGSLAMFSAKAMPETARASLLTWLLPQDPVMRQCQTSPFRGSEDGSRITTEEIVFMSVWFA